MKNRLKNAHLRLCKLRFPRQFFMQDHLADGNSPSFEIQVIFYNQLERIVSSSSNPVLFKVENNWIESLGIFANSTFVFNNVFVARPRLSLSAFVSKICTAIS